MGKSKKVRKGPTSRCDPLQNTNGSNGNGHVALNGVLSSAVLDTITAQLQSVNSEDKACACHSISNLCEEEEARTKIVERKFVKMIAPFLLESDAVLVSAAMGCLYNLSSQGADTVDHIVSQDILTPLFSLMTQFSGILSFEDKMKRVQSERIIEDSFNLARNILQESEDALETFNTSSILSNITPFMTDIAGARVRVSCLQLLATASQGNPRGQEALASHLNTLTSLAASQETDLGVRISAALVMASSDKLISDEKAFLSIMECVSPCLDVNTLDLLSQLDKNDKQKVEALADSLNAQITALEILTNLSSFEEVEGYNSEDSDAEIDDNFTNEMEEEGNFDMGRDHEAFIKCVIKFNILVKLVDRASQLTTEAKIVIKESKSGQFLLGLHEKLVTDSYLCLSNVTEIMTVDQLGGGEAVKTVWLDLASKLCAKPEDTDLVDALSSAVRSLTSQVVRPEAGVSLENVGTNDLEQLVSVYSLYNTEKAANIRTNIVNILGGFGMVAARNITDPACKLVITKLTSWILETVVSDACLRVSVEGFDRIFDVFSEDDSDGLFAELNLLTKLKHLQPILQKRIKKESKSLQHEDRAVTSTIKLNLQRFVAYKEKALISPR